MIKNPLRKVSVDIACDNNGHIFGDVPFFVERCQQGRRRALYALCCPYRFPIKLLRAGVTTLKCLRRDSFRVGCATQLLKQNVLFLLNPDLAEFDRTDPLA